MYLFVLDYIEKAFDLNLNKTFFFEKNYKPYNYKPYKPYNHVGLIGRNKIYWYLRIYTTYYAKRVKKPKKLWSLPANFYNKFSPKSSLKTVFFKTILLHKEVANLSVAKIFL